MAKKIQLQIPTPCHENWENMTAVEKGRFCASCQKKVIDFSTMSDREIAMFFKKPSTNSVCGRFTEEQLNRVIDIPKKRIPWVKYFFQFALPAFLASMKISAQEDKLQGEVAAVYVAANKKENKHDVVNQRNHVKITGKVIDENGNPMPYASIIIKGTKKGVATDSSGVFSLQLKSNWENIALSVSYIGFAPVEKTLNRKDSVQDIEIKLKSSEMTEENLKVIVVGYTRKYTMGAVCSGIRIIGYGKEQKDTSENFFKIYPNPVRSNSALHIEWKQKDFGYHSLQLFNQSGQLVFSNEIYIDEEARLLSINMPSVTTGSYFLKITNKTTGRSFTEKLIVE